MSCESPFLSFWFVCGYLVCLFLCPISIISREQTCFGKLHFYIFFEYWGWIYHRVLDILSSTCITELQYGTPWRFPNAMAAKLAALNGVEVHGHGVQIAKNASVWYTLIVNISTGKRLAKFFWKALSFLGSFPYKTWLCRTSLSYSFKGCVSPLKNGDFSISQVNFSGGYIVHEISFSWENWSSTCPFCRFRLLQSPDGKISTGCFSLAAAEAMTLTFFGGGVWPNEMFDQKSPTNELKCIGRKWCFVYKKNVVRT